MKITFIAPRLEKLKFTGGIYCILRHANELQAKGHQVSIIAYPKSEVPEWIDLKANLIIPKTYTNQKLKLPHENFLANITHALGYVGRKYNGGLHAISAIEEIMKHYIPQSDVTVATLWETARLVAKHGSGKKAYFCQHYEPVFSEDPVIIADIEATYHYGLKVIANSTWLKQKLLENKKQNPNHIYLANNAIDTDLFHPNPYPAKHSPENTLKIISYGGRDAKWKGFEDMARAVAIARKSIPDQKIIWNVYGDALLPADNKIANYNALGFLNPQRLSQEYSKNDILLSASWYESFPLFPIEAMACGLPVITTQFGVEDYASHNENCLIVEPQNPESISSAIISLAKNNELRKRLKNRAMLDARKFTWERASHQMEYALQQITLSQ